MQDALRINIYRIMMGLLQFLLFSSQDICCGIRLWFLEIGLSYESRQAMPIRSGLGVICKQENRYSGRRLDTFGILVYYLCKRILHCP